jgi:hypothetical protein
MGFRLGDRAPRTTRHRIAAPAGPGPAAPGPTRLAAHAAALRPRCARSPGRAFEGDPHAESTLLRHGAAGPPVEGERGPMEGSGRGAGRGQALRDVKCSIAISSSWPYSARSRGQALRDVRSGECGVLRGMGWAWVRDWATALRNLTPPPHPRARRSGHTLTTRAWIRGFPRSSPGVRTRGAPRWPRPRPPRRRRRPPATMLAGNRRMVRGRAEGRPPPTRHPVHRPRWGDADDIHPLRTVYPPGATVGHGHAGASQVSRSPSLAPRRGSATRTLRIRTPRVHEARPCPCTSRRGRPPPGAQAARARARGRRRMRV